MKKSKSFASRLNNLKPEGAYAVMTKAQALESDGRHRLEKNKRKAINRLLNIVGLLRLRSNDREVLVLLKKLSNK